MRSCKCCWFRCWLCRDLQNQRVRPPARPSRKQIPSQSRTALCARIELAISFSSGNFSVTRFPWRVNASTLSPCLWIRIRHPSHFGSKIYLSSLKASSRASNSIGLIGVKSKTVHLMVIVSRSRYVKLQGMDGKEIARHYAEIDKYTRKRPRVWGLFRLQTKLPRILMERGSFSVNSIILPVMKREEPALHFRSRWQSCHGGTLFRGTPQPPKRQLARR
jgi:hypothetical protein